MWISPLLIVRLSILNVITLAKCLNHLKQNGSYYLYLCLEPFVFLFLLFQVQALDHHHAITIVMIFTVASSFGIVLPISWSLRWTRLALRVSSIHQNQTRAFNLPLFGNWWQPFHKDMNWNSIESMLLVQAYLPCVKRIWTSFMNPVW